MLKAALSVFCLVALAGCRPANTGSALTEYEKAGYRGQSICTLMKDEAKRDGAAKAFDQYKEIFARERDIFAIIEPKAQRCSTSVPPAAEKGATGTPAPSSGPLADPSLAAGEIGTVPPSAITECDGLIDPGIAADLTAKRAEMERCDPFASEQEQRLKDELAGAASPQQPQQPQQQQQSPGQAPSTQDKPQTTADGTPQDPQRAQSPDSERSQPSGESASQDVAEGFSLQGSSGSVVCDWIGVQPDLCKGLVGQGFKLEEQSLKKICGVVGKILKDKKLAPQDSKATAECSAQIVEDMCGKYGAMVVAGEKALDDAAKSVEEKAKTIALEAVRATIKSAMSSVVACVTAYGREKAEQAAVAAVEEVTKSAFSAAIERSEGFLKDKRAMAVVKMACEVSTTIGGIAVGKYEKGQAADTSCDGILDFDKQRVAACLQSAKDGCDILSGSLNLAASLDLGDQLTAAKVAADLASTTISSACAAGGKVSSAACAALGKASGYIKDAFLGQSNPWADCAGTPQIAQCLHKRWTEWSSGIQDADFKVGREDAKKNEVSDKYENRICWCYRRCMSSDWGRDREVFSGLWYTVAEKGDAGVRFCAAQNRTVIWPSGKLTWESGRRNVYLKWDSCEIGVARSNEPTLLQGQRTLEVLYEGSWKKFQMAEPGECGGRTDQGV